MTVAQELKAVKIELKNLKARKSSLGSAERQQFKNQIKNLTKKDNDANKSYTLMMKYKNAFLKVQEKHHQLQKRMDHIHKFYKDILKDRK